MKVGASSGARISIVRRKIMKKSALLVILLVLLSGCSSSGKVIAGHFEKMTEIARDNQEDCDAMSRELSSYLEGNQSSISRAAADTGNADQKEADHVYVASFELHQATDVCDTAEIQAFWKRLSRLILQTSPKE